MCRGPFSELPYIQFWYIRQDLLYFAVSLADHRKDSPSQFIRLTPLAPLHPMSKRSPRFEQEALVALLREIRSEAELRQVDLAKKLGQPQPFVSRYESGERRLDILELRHVCRAVGVTLQEFAARLEQQLQ